MSDPDAGEYDLADLPEPRAPGAPAPQPRPLPRLWKSETDDEEQPATDAPGKETENAATGAKQTRPPEARSRPSAAKSRPRAKGAHAAEGQEKKALVEETPALDTYEARQRGRLVIGGLITACFAIFGWIFYQLFFHDPSPIDGPTDEAHAVSSAPEPSRDLDVEARALLNRAQEHANAGRVKEAVALLETLVKSYRGTNTAAEARKALDRPRQNLPLFLDRPTIQASSAPAPAEPAAPPPPVVTAVPNPTRGNATLTLPANPAEITPSPGPPQDLTMATTATATATATVTAPTPTPTPTAAGGGPGPAMPARVLPRGFRPRASTSLDASGWPLAIVGDRDGAPMVLVPGGTFLMGNDDGPPAESPAHKVRLSTYYIDQHEVTVRQFRVFLGETHYRGQPPRSWSTDLGESVPDTQPMVMVNARDALAYAEWALKHLPTEAQWEMAARSSDGRLYPWGPQPAAADRPRSAETRVPVMTDPNDRSPFGAFDMGGNVLEWTRDWYDSRYYRQLSAGILDNPTGPAARPRSQEVVVKGDRKTGSAATRQGMMREKRLTFVGFRCVLPVEDHAAVSPAGGIPGPGLAPPSQGRPPATAPRQGDSTPAVPF